MMPLYDEAYRDELREAARPLMEFLLRRHGNPYMKALVEHDHVVVMQAHLYEKHKTAQVTNVPLS